MNARVRILILVVVLSVALATLAQTTPQPAISSVISLFDHYPIVIIGEDHWLRANGEFYISLVSSPEFAKHADTLVLECGNSLYQAILDRYENGEDIPFGQISQVWRNTTKVMAWESPIYANLIAAVRDVNRGLPAAERIRVIAADSPIDWSLVHDSRDYEKAFGGNEFFASIIEREVLTKKRKALVIMGDNHVTRGGDARGYPNLTSMIEKRARHSIYVILADGLRTNSDPALRGTAPSLYPLRRTPVGQEWSNGRRAEEAADAFLYLGASRAKVGPDWEALQSDIAYFAELQRRHLIEFGCPLNLETWKSLSNPCPRSSSESRFNSAGR